MSEPADQLIKRLRLYPSDPTLPDNYSDAMLDAAAEIERLNAELAEWRKLRDPATLHANLLRGLPAQLTPEQVQHLAGLRSQWQPIETAPRDGTEFLGWSSAEYLGSVPSMDKTWAGWTDDDGNTVYVHADWVSWAPTHWMPLPAPPTAETL